VAGLRLGRSSHVVGSVEEEHCLSSALPSRPTLGVDAGRSSLLAALFQPDAPNAVAPSAYNEDDPPGGVPASPLAPRPEATGFRWVA
jgi:hypothetical protein